MGFPRIGGRVGGGVFCVPERTEPVAIPAKPVFSREYRSYGLFGALGLSDHDLSG